MSSLDVKPTAAFARHISIDDEVLRVDLTDGRSIAAPLEWFPKLRNATPAQRANWRLIGQGVGIHWEELDEDLSVAGLLTH
ncbi:MAG: DUF2442 domain-containing protein [Armatimonadetes bacterium]|nr:DUF2442 domain-containing protein [Armatimonadota bacterium]